MLSDILLDNVSRQMTVSNMKRNYFRHTCIDVWAIWDGMMISMGYYINSMQDVDDITERNWNESSSLEELNEYRKVWKI